MELVEARKQARYSQESVAGLMGISRPTYAKMEADPESVTIEDAKKLAAIFGVNVVDIFLAKTVVKHIVRWQGRRTGTMDRLDCLLAKVGNGLRRIDQKLASYHGYRPLGYGEGELSENAFPLNCHFEVVGEAEDVAFGKGFDFFDSAALPAGSLEKAYRNVVPRITGREVPAVEELPYGEVVTVRVYGFDRAARALKVTLVSGVYSKLEKEPEQVKGDVHEPPIAITDCKAEGNLSHPMASL